MASKQFRSILLLGPPGVGKGTQGKVLGELPGFSFVSMGDVLRSVERESELGKQIYSFLDHGNLAPAKLVIDALGRHMESIDSELSDSFERFWILDGVPRNAEQAGLLSGQVDVQKVLHLECDSDTVLVGRLRRRGYTSNRPDDQDEKIMRHRLELYREQTEPLLKTFSKEKVAHIDGSATPIMVLRQIVDSLA